MTTPTTKRNPWSWIPTLYFAEGLPYVAVMTIAVIMYKRLGLSNTEIALYTSWLYLPWTIKPLWSPFVDLVKTKRSWIIAMQGFIAAGFAGIAFLSQRHITYNSPLLSFGYWHSVRLPMTSQQTVLYARPQQQGTIFLCRHPKHILPTRQYFRARYSRHACRMVGNLSRQYTSSMEHHFLPPGRIIPGSYFVPSLYPPPSRFRCQTSRTHSR